MPAPTSSDEFLSLVRKSGVVDEKRLEAFLNKVRAAGSLPPEPVKTAVLLVRENLLTRFQAEQILQGRWKRFTIGNYKVLEPIGSGGMGTVYLCEHRFMRRRAAVKVLPNASAADSSALERFYREARVVAALDHPNIVRAYDSDQDGDLHYFVMEFVEGESLQELVTRTGPLEPARAAHYISQAAQGLQYAHEAAGIVHRDIKPANLIVDRSGVVKLLDMGLARYFHDEEDRITQKYDENVLGTADYLAPEQVLDSHTVDIRADVYSLGATFYFCLTGRTPFGEGTVSQKLIWHQTRRPKPVTSLRADVPKEMAAVIEKMMAKDPDQRYPLPGDVVEALAPWAHSVLPPRAGESPAESTAPPEPVTPPPTHQPRGRKAWQVPGQDAARPETPEASQNSALRAGEAQTALEMQPAPGEELFRLEAPETKEVAVADTQLSGLRKRRRPAPPRVSRWQEIFRRRIVWWSLVPVSVLFLGAFLVAWALRAPPARVGAEAPPSAARRTLVVKRGDDAGTFPTVREALRRARPRDRIVVADEVVEEQLDLVDVSDLTIEPASDRVVLWRCPEAGDAKQLLFLSHAAGVCVRGFVFDGRERVDQIALLTGECPGLTLENVQLRGFRRAAVVVANCSGMTNRPVALLGVETIAAQERDAALAFRVTPRVMPPTNEHFLVRGCRFLGVYRNPVFLQDPAALRDYDFGENYVQPRPNAPMQLMAAPPSQ